MTFERSNRQTYNCNHTEIENIMFGNKSKSKSQDKPMSSSKKSNSTANAISSACVIVKGTVIEGDFKSPNDTRMDGTVIGNINCAAKIIMGAEAKVEGNIDTHQAKIAGLFSGELKVKDLLQLSNTAKLDGTINTAQLEMEEGATVNGTLKVGKEK